jgi:hypothetical protein
MSRLDNNNLRLQLTSLLNLFYVASSSLQSEQPLPSQIPAPRHVIAMSSDLDRRLSLMAGNNLTTQFVLFGGAYVELCKVRGDIMLLLYVQTLIFGHYIVCRATCKGVPVNLWHLHVASTLIS